MKSIKSYFKSASKEASEEEEIINDVLIEGLHRKKIETRNTETKEGTSTNKLVAEKPFQPSSSYSFPKTRWFADFKWLDYNEPNDYVTCFICKKHSKNIEMEKNKEEAFLSVGFRNWKKALDAFKEHQK
jgi:hypothetical protein